MPSKMRGLAAIMLAIIAGVPASAQSAAAAIPSSTASPTCPGSNNTIYVTSGSGNGYQIQCNIDHFASECSPSLTLSIRTDSCRWQHW